AQVFPRQLRGVALGEGLDLIAVDHQGVFTLDLHIAFILTMHGVIFEEIAEVVGRHEVVDADKIDLTLVLQRNTGHEPSDASKTVDGNSNGHERSSSQGVSASVTY